MKYSSKDVVAYSKAKEYIDTAIIPLIPFSFEDEEMSSLSFQKDVIQIYVDQIERELKGRVFVIPEYYYLKQDKIAEEKERLQAFIDHIAKQPFKYIFLVTSDNKWRKVTKDMDIELIWIPGIKDGHLEQAETQQVIKSQVQEIQTLIMDSWNE
ncbi:DUF2487 family protein [Tenuibacillus multivorans]|uniref:DUF2487 domain-containing protein n=1 Tax=Tenuibacillus multivorans TaxID=237069 RepID=A0A1H0CU60_9BACI|nr:DUF2487 family protein [Tenuibacillus multivorans]GEL76162.1 hypothetical protein TMU01_03970 [Tenuibacillus multivorans]SDN61409.1 Protein of unknown function [Tenuibacillus multivorans]